MQFERQPPGRRQSILLIVGAVIAGLCVGAIVTGVIRDEDRETGAAPSPRNATVSDLVRRPGRFLRREVGVSGEVAEVLGPRAVVLGGKEFQGGDALLVIGRERFTTPGARRDQRALLENDLVDVHGTLRVFDKEQLQERLGVSLGDHLQEFEGKPVLVVKEILVTPRRLDLHDQVAIDQIASRPRSYIGKLVSVEGRVTKVVRGQAFVLEDKLLVLAAEVRTGAIKAGQRLTVLGGVRRLDPDQLPERANIDERLFGELAARPAIVAQAVERP